MARRIIGTRDVNFQVNVIGLLWQGGVGTYAYTFVTFPGDTTIKAKASDFQAVEDYEVTRITHGGTWAHEWTRRKIVKKWRDEINGDTYLQMTCLEQN